MKDNKEKISEYEIAEIMRFGGDRPKDFSKDEKSAYELEVEKAYYQRWHDYE